MGVVKTFEYMTERLKRSHDSKYILQYAKKLKLANNFHSHDFYEITLVVSGKVVQIINDVQYTMQAQDYVVITPGNEHRFTYHSDDVTVLIISIAADELEKFKLLYGPSFTLPNNYLDSVVMSLKMDCNTIINMFGLSNYYYNDNTLRALCACVFSELAVADVNKTAAIPKQLKFMLDKLHKDESLLKEGIEAMMRLSNYSRSQLDRLMKNYCGKTTNEYLRCLRLETAYKMILLTDENLEYISIKCGYESLSHFNKIFKSYHGITMAALRKSADVFTV